MADLPAPAKTRVVRRYSVSQAPELAATLERYEDDPAPLNLNSEIALLRTMVDACLQEHGLKRTGTLAKLLESVTRCVESQSRIENACGLTPTQAERLTMEMALAFERAVVKIVTDPKQRVQLLQDVKSAWKAIRL